MSKSCSLEPNELVGKQKPTYSGRGLYPVKKDSYKHGKESAPEMTRAQRMKGFKGDKVSEEH